MENLLQTIDPLLGLQRVFKLVAAINKQPAVAWLTSYNLVGGGNERPKANISGRMPYWSVERYDGLISRGRGEFVLTAAG